MFQSYDKNSSFLHFMNIFMSHCPYFLGSREIYMSGKYAQKLVFFVFYCPQFGGSKAIYNDHNTLYIFVGIIKNLCFFLFYGRFHEVLSIVFLFQGVMHGQ